MKTLTIANEPIGATNAAYLIAEAGVNHNGRLAMALRLIDAAAEAGANAVKFQTFRAHQVTTASAEMASYQKKNLGVSQSQLAIIKKLELDEKFYPTLIRRCRQRKITFLSSPHGGVQSLRFLARLGLPAYKIGSADLTNLPLLDAAGRTMKPIIVSTGMGTIPEIREAIRTIRRTGNRQIVLLHCTTDYPARRNEINLNAMVTMRQVFHLPIGYSDHTNGIDIPLFAVAAGACLIEKHFTLDRSLPGPDQRASLEPSTLAGLARGMRDLHVIMGSRRKVPTPSERIMLPLVRKSVVTLIPIPKGARFTEKNIGIKRPGTGMHPRFFTRLLGKRAVRDLKEDRLLRDHDVQ